MTGPKALLPLVGKLQLWAMFDHAERDALLALPHKVERVYNYHHATLHALAELLAAGGVEHPQQLRRIHFAKRSSTTKVDSFAQLYPSLRPGELIDGTSDPRFREAWALSRAESFQPVIS